MEPAFPSPTRRPADQIEPAPVTLNVFSGLHREHGFVPLRVEGVVPPSLRGTLYRNGPSVFNAGRNPHWFDGNGAVSAVRFLAGEVQGAVRILRSPSAMADAGHRKASYGGFLQPMGLGKRLSALFGGQGIRNNANINVLAWQRRLFALYEATLPLELDPETLSSRSETNLGGVILKGVNAHHHRVPGRKATYLPGLRIGPSVLLDIYELPDQGGARRLTSLPLPGVMEVHDIMVTLNHVIVVLPPLSCSSMELLWNGSFARSMHWRPEQGTEIVVIPIDRPDQIARLHTEALFFWHGINAFERTRSLLTFDLISYPDFPSVLAYTKDIAGGGASLPNSATVLRGELDLYGREIGWHPISSSPTEFGTVHPGFVGAPARIAWLAGFGERHESKGFWDRLVRLDLQTGELLRMDPGTRAAVSEPVLAARSDQESDVWVLAYLHDLEAHSTCLGIWDGLEPEKGTVARIWFDQQLPPTLHGTFVPER